MNLNLKENMMIDKELKDFLTEEGYTHLTIKNGRVCGLHRMIFTVGLFVGLTRNYREGRYCFPTYRDAELALEEWDGIGDPPGNWIKYKGRTEYSNPNLNKEENEDL